MLRRLYSTTHKWTAKELNATLNLPKTTLPQRGNYALLNEELVKTRLKYDLSINESSEKETFTIHDGPPFANGDLHIGHALNKFLKDTILRFKITQGYHVHFQPAWDCHGLPIEQKALKANHNLDPLPLREVCKIFAMEAVIRQKNTMQKWGLFADYKKENILTMNPSYEASQLQVFSKFVEKGLTYSDTRPVFWSPSSKTALAEAELEYRDDHISQACLIQFLVENYKHSALLLVWTTTPWTVPANQGVAINTTSPYIIVSNPNTCQKYIIAQSRQPFIEDLLKTKLNFIESIPSEALLKLTFRNSEQGGNPILHGDFVTSDSGTGLVHLAPAYGQEDFRLCRSNGIIEKSIVNENGTFNLFAPESLQGKSVISEDGIHASIYYLKEKDLLLHTYAYEHKYPYDWRTKKPVIQMATRQLFINTAAIHTDLIKALDKITFLPESGKRRLHNMLVGRSEWCISRQRSWGVPIPAFYYKSTGEILMDVHTVDHFAKLVGVGGTDVWWSNSIEDLLPPKYKHLADDLEKGRDTLDVWFDSGTMWSQHTMSADVYIEGSDQFRGWFQSSFISSIVARGEVPCKTLIAHGFVLDEKGNKMSKSIGNVINPEDVLYPARKPARSIDVLRLWAASSNFLCDAQISEQSLNQMTEQHQKLRNTLRFILANLSGYNPSNTTSHKPLDQMIIQRVQRLVTEVMAKFNKFDFQKGLGLIQGFVEDDLSAFYFDCIKNRLYLEGLESEWRQSAQYALVNILSCLLKVLDPVAPLLCTEVRSHLPVDICNSIINHHLSTTESDISLQYEKIRTLRKTVLSQLQKLQRDQMIASTYQVELILDDKVNQPFSVKDLAEILMVAKVHLNHDNMDNVELLPSDIVPMYKSSMEKCPRCWIYRMSHDDQDVCSPCHQIIQTLTK